MRKLVLISWIIIIILFVTSLYFYTILPDKITTHWNSSGVPNGTMSKEWGLFLIPLITLVIFILFILIPKIDPLRKNIEKFLIYFDSFILIFILFMFYIHMITIIWNLGIKINMNLLLIPAIGFLYIYIGILLRQVKQNWFIGIRTPWTLSNKVVWDKTHKLGSKLFIISGIITLIGIFFLNYTIWFVLVPILLSAIWLVIYSYIEFRKGEKG